MGNIIAGPDHEEQEIEISAPDSKLYTERSAATPKPPAAAATIPLHPEPKSPRRSIAPVAVARSSSHPSLPLRSKPGAAMARKRAKETAAPKRKMAPPRLPLNNRRDARVALPRLMNAPTSDQSTKKSIDRSRSKKVKQGTASNSTVSKGSVVKRKPGRPRKHPLPEETIKPNPLELIAEIAPPKPSQIVPRPPLTTEDSGSKEQRIPKKKRGRPRKHSLAVPASNTEESASFYLAATPEATSQDANRGSPKKISSLEKPIPKRKRGRPRKHPVVVPASNTEESAPIDPAETTEATLRDANRDTPENISSVEEPIFKKKRGRPRKHPLVIPASNTEESASLPQAATTEATSQDAERGTPERISSVEKPFPTKKRKRQRKHPGAVLASHTEESAPLFPAETTEATSRDANIDTSERISSVEEPLKRKRGRPKKHPLAAAASNTEERAFLHPAETKESSQDANRGTLERISAVDESIPKRKRGRPKQHPVAAPASDTEESAPVRSIEKTEARSQNASKETQEKNSRVDQPILKKKRGRPRNTPTEETTPVTQMTQTTAHAPVNPLSLPIPRKKRGRPRKNRVEECEPTTYGSVHMSGKSCRMASPAVQTDKSILSEATPGSPPRSPMQAEESRPYTPGCDSVSIAGQGLDTLADLDGIVDDLPAEAHTLSPRRAETSLETAQPPKVPPDEGWRKAGKGFLAGVSSATSAPARPEASGPRKKRGRQTKNPLPTDGAPAEVEHFVGGDAVLSVSRPPVTKTAQDSFACGSTPNIVSAFLPVKSGPAPPLPADVTVADHSEVRVVVFDDEVETARPSEEREASAYRPLMSSFCDEESTDSDYSLSGDTDESFSCIDRRKEIEAPKRKRGHQKRNNSYPIEGSSAAPAGDDTTPVKRKVGRPRKHHIAPAAGPSSTSKAVKIAPIKRKPGRPRKHPIAPAAGPAPPKTDKIAPIKRQSGHPRKDAIAPAAGHSFPEAIKIAPIKRKRGRPRKYPIPDRDAANTAQIKEKAACPQEHPNPDPEAAHTLSIKKKPRKPRRYPLPMNESKISQITMPPGASQLFDDLVATANTLPGPSLRKRGRHRKKKEPTAETAHDPTCREKGVKLPLNRRRERPILESEDYATASLMREDAASLSSSEFRREVVGDGRPFDGLMSPPKRASVQSTSMATQTLKIPRSAVPRDISLVRPPENRIVYPDSVHQASVQFSESDGCSGELLARNAMSDEPRSDEHVISERKTAEELQRLEGEGMPLPNSLMQENISSLPHAKMSTVSATSTVSHEPSYPNITEKIAAPLNGKDEEETAQTKQSDTGTGTRNACPSAEREVFASRSRHVSPTASSAESAAPILGPFDGNGDESEQVINPTKPSASIVGVDPASTVPKCPVVAFLDSDGASRLPLAFAFVDEGDSSNIKEVRAQLSREQRVRDQMTRIQNGEEASE